MSRVAVAGAGLTGCLLAVRLAEAGHDVHLFDRRPDLRRRDVDAGRSINLALSTRGLDALARVGLDHVVLAEAIEMPGRMMHDRSGHTTFQPYGTEPDHVLQSVNRDALNIALLDAVDATDGITACFEHRVRDLSVRRGEVTIEQPGGTHTDTFDVVYGCDGAYSAVRGRLQRVGRVDFSQSFLSHGYKELSIPPGPDGEYQLDPHALHIWPRGSHMMIALANPDRSFTCTLFWPFDDAVGFDTIGAAEIVATFRDQFPDALPLMADLTHEYETNPASSLVTIRTGPWYHDGHALILGDAAHAVVPFYGQGANAALEDVTILMDLYKELGQDNHHEVFEAFYEARKPHTDALADLAVLHFEEMRDSVSSRWFLLGKHLERVAAKLAPGTFVPLYTLVSFTRTPYAEAVERAHRQNRWLSIGAAALTVTLLVIVLALLVLS